MNNRVIFTICMLVFLLASCAGPKPAANPAQEPAAQPTGPAQPAAPSPVPPTEPAAPAQRGSGSFDLPDPAAGLGDLPRFQAVLRMVFDGTRGGQPYHIEKTYDRSVDTNSGAQLLTESGKHEDGSAYQIFSGTLGEVRYGKPAPDQACQVGQAAPVPASFSPASLLPKLLGADSAGQETVENIPADVYTFDQRALGAGDKSTASGKVWIAQQGGWVVKYELSMKSAVVFGEGIDGEQRWEYTVRDPGETGLSLPEDCPLPLADAPIPDGAAGILRLPGEVRFQTTMDQSSLEQYYTEQLKAQGFLRQGAPVNTTGGTRWLFGKREANTAVLYVLTSKPDGSGQSVRLVRVVTDAPPAQGQ